MREKLCFRYSPRLHLRMQYGVHALSVFVFLFQIVGYVALSTGLEYCWYHRRRHRRAEWKTQPDKGAAATTTDERWVWGLPALDLLFSNRQTHLRGQRHPRHALFASVNLLVSALFAGGVTEAALRGHTALASSSSSTAPGVSGLLLGFEAMPLALAVAWQCVAEYYWHRWMHCGVCYRRWHKLHHHYKAPRPFDDLFIHPLEAMGYYCILYSPTVLLSRLPVASFAVYMIIMGACGVLDHSGVRLGWRGVYATADHDEHHRLFNVNYAFPFPFMDLLHRTHHAPRAVAKADRVLLERRYQV